MFRIDADCVVDATMTGGPARYINHSCDVSTSTGYFFIGSTEGDGKLMRKPISFSKQPIAIPYFLCYVMITSSSE